MDSQNGANMRTRLIGQYKKWAKKARAKMQVFWYCPSYLFDLEYWPLTYFETWLIIKWYGLLLKHTLRLVLPNCLTFKPYLASWNRVNEWHFTCSLISWSFMIEQIQSFQGMFQKVSKCTVYKCKIERWNVLRHIQSQK